MNDFDCLVIRLRKEGYLVEVTNAASDKMIYRFAKVTGQDIQGGFCEPSGDTHPHIDGKFAADHVDCFDKWSKCPLVANLPKDSKDEDRIIESLKRLASPEGYKVSNSYDYLDSNPFIYEV